MKNSHMDNGHGVVIAAATDGACSGNPGPGGWGGLIRYEDGSVEEFGGFSSQTTNNRMELKAALTMLEKLKGRSLHKNLTIRTDSKYLIEGLSKWIIGWKKKGWKTSGGKPVLNQDLWEALDNARIPNVSLEYVKGHSGDKDNDRVDEIAVKFSKRIAIELKSFELPIITETKGTKRIKKKLIDDEIAPIELQHLLTRLDIANEFAEKQYGLTIIELAKLTNEPLKELEKRKNVWKWRDWLVEPINDSQWRLHLYEKQSNNIIEDKNE